MSRLLYRIGRYSAVHKWRMVLVWVAAIVAISTAGQQWGGEPADSLLETRFAGVMAQAAARFDVVIVLATTLDRSDDARVMAARGSLILAVPEAGVSQRELRLQASRIRSVGVRLLGVVMVGRRAERMAS